MSKIRFHAALIGAARILEDLAGEQHVLIGSIAGKHVIQPQQTLVRAQTQIVNQTTAAGVTIIASFLERIGISHVHDLRHHIVHIHCAKMTGGDMAGTDQLQISHLRGVGSSFLLFENPGGTKYRNFGRFHLTEDSLSLTADSVNWGAGETHSYVVQYAIYRLTEPIVNTLI